MGGYRRLLGEAAAWKTRLHLPANQQETNIIIAPTMILPDIILRQLARVSASQAGSATVARAALLQIGERLVLEPLAQDVGF